MEILFEDFKLVSIVFVFDFFGVVLEMVLLVFEIFWFYCVGKICVRVIF